MIQANRMAWILYDDNDLEGITVYMRQTVNAALATIMMASIQTEARAFHLTYIGEFTVAYILKLLQNKFV